MDHKLRLILETNSSHVSVVIVFCFTSASSCLRRIWKTFSIQVRRSSWYLDHFAFRMTQGTLCFCWCLRGIVVHDKQFRLSFIFFQWSQTDRLLRSFKTAGRPTLLHTFLIGYGLSFPSFFFKARRSRSTEILTIDAIFRCEELVSFFKNKTRARCSGFIASPKTISFRSWIVDLVLMTSFNN